jgi:hypothetical protein
MEERQVVAEMAPRNEASPTGVGDQITENSDNFDDDQSGEELGKFSKVIIN